MATPITHTLTLDVSIPVKLASVNFTSQTATFNLPESGSNVVAAIGDAVSASSSRAVGRSEALALSPNNAGLSASVTSSVTISFVLEAVPGSNSAVVRLHTGDHFEIPVGGLVDLVAFDREFKLDQDADF